MSPAQCRAARALLGWNQWALASASGVSINTIRDFEGGKRTPIKNNFDAIRGALVEAGVRFVYAEGESGVVIQSE